MSGGNLAGCQYYERGRPVTVITSWGPGGGPRNVEIEREDGSRVVRPFRGLRKDPPQSTKLTHSPALPIDC
jgi:acetyl esterase